MTASGTRLTKRGRTVLVVAGVVAVALVVTGIVVYRTVFSDHCQVRADGRDVHLGRDETVRMTQAAADAALAGTSVRSAVQRTTDLSSGDTDAVVAAVTGKAHAALTCTRGGASGSASGALSSEGLTARAEAVHADIEKHFGRLPLGGFAPGGVHTGHMPGSAHYEGRAIDVFFRPVNARDKDAGWALAQYLVAQAERLKIATVIFDAKIWTAKRGFQGWRDYTVPDPQNAHDAAQRATLEHRDHVHVDVPR